ncbi:macrophage mannose receptor 1 [Drosophila ficusphila]|uniref:macrophage mannose receptor 1 n=1 Tax=Drosophila ficusphila TaxID=30025 RepID=UPI0007E68ADF|nr:macrophage mannose receptor 1 [Drosophila ficusphila]
MFAILFAICSLPLWATALNSTVKSVPNFAPRCDPLDQCDPYFSVANFAKVSWIEANHICNRVGAVLATVRNEENHQLILDYVNSNERVFGNKTFWLGATNLVERAYIWTWLSTGIPVTYAQWAKHEPKSDLDGSDACLFLGLDNFWHSASCGAKHYFICENICQLSYTSLDQKIYL